MMDNPTISFDQISINERVPGVYGEIDTSQAFRRYASPPNRRLALIGQMTADGSAEVGDLVRVFGSDDAKTLFGPGSELHLMALAALATNTGIELLALPIAAEAGAVAATATVTLGGGPATKDAQGTCRIGHRRLTWTVESGDEAAAAAAALAAAINAETELPVTAAAASAVVTLTAKCKGLVGNELTFEVYAGTEITVTPTAMASGAGGLDLDSTALVPLLKPALGLQPSHLCPSDNSDTALTALRTHLETVADPTAMDYAYGFCGHVGTLSAATTLAAAIDSWWESGGALEQAESLSYEIGAGYTAAIMLESDVARPRQDLVIKGVTGPTSSDKVWTHSEQNTLIQNGICPLVPNNRGELVIVREATMQVTDADGDECDVWDHSVVETSCYLMQDARDYLQSRFRRAKKYDGIHDDIKEAFLGRARTMWFDKLVLVLNPDRWADTVLVLDNATDPARIDLQADVMIVVGLRVIAFKMRIVL